MDTATSNIKEVERRDPTEKELESPLFNAIWEVIKKWDISTDEKHEWYAGATGTDVCVVLDSISEVEVPEYYRTVGDTNTITNQPATIGTLLKGKTDSGE